MADLVTGDTGSTLVVTCKDNESGAVINLTGATVKLRWEATAIETRVMSISNALAGIAQYKFLVNEIIAPKMKFEIEITDSLGFIISNLILLELTVREQIG